MGKEQTIKKIQMYGARGILIDQIMHGPPAKTWSATMPPYCYTVLCPDPRYQYKRR